MVLAQAEQLKMFNAKFVELRKLEKDFVKEAQNLPEKQFEDVKRQKIAKEILISQSTACKKSTIPRMKTLIEIVGKLFRRAP